jgi:hypothetical protein
VIAAVTKRLKMTRDWSAGKGQTGDIIFTKSCLTRQPMDTIILNCITEVPALSIVRIVDSREGFDRESERSQTWLKKNTLYPENICCLLKIQIDPAALPEYRRIHHDLLSSMPSSG